MPRVVLLWNQSNTFGLSQDASLIEKALELQTNFNLGPIVIKINNQYPSTPTLMKLRKNPLINKEK